jgi:hypothetical protein
MQPQVQDPLPMLARGVGVTDDEAADAPWHAALAGRPDPQADPVVNAQASALRDALRRREVLLEMQAPKADEALLQQVQFRLRREGLTGRHPAAALATRWPMWGLAATVVLGVAVYLATMTQHTPPEAETDVLRGGAGSALELRVADPQARLVSLQAALQAAGATPRVTPLPDGRIRVEVAATPAVLDELSRQRLEPQVVDGQVTLLLVPTAPLGPERRP